jgi:hypothetical protein
MAASCGKIKSAPVELNAAGQSAFRKPEFGCYPRRDAVPGREIQHPKLLPGTSDIILSIALPSDR